MASSAEHYENLLARHYTWMSGGHDTQVAACARFFRELNLPAAGQKALDLGCGSGFQSLALAELGFDVTSMDTSAELLAELRARPGANRVTAIQGDIRDASHYSARGPFSVAVCMGDTLTHLASFEEVEALLRSIRECLAPDGTLILGFRDLTRELTGIDRAIPVRSDADRLMTVFLEFEPGHVTVNDMIYVRENGAWTFAKSAHKKLRLGAERVIVLLKQLGFQHIEHRIERGFSTFVARG
jgi:SAM-dependent methyltransferase